MVLKKVLGFATTMSLILLVMVAPTTTTATASLQQEGNATIDEPNIPIGPADEEEEPDEPIPDNENETDDDGDDGGGSGGGAGDGNVTVVCPAILKGMFETDKKTYNLGEDATVRGQFSAMRGDENYNMPVEVTYTSPSGKEYGPNNVWPEYSGGDCGWLNFHFTIETVAEPGTWKVSAVYPRLNLNMDTQFKVVAVAEEAGCQEPPVREITTHGATYNLGEDVIVSGLFSASPRDRENNTPVEVRYRGPEDASYVSNEVQPEYSSDGGCRYLGFEFVLKNVQQVGTWEVSAVYPPLKIDLYTQFVVYPGQGIPRCEDIGSPGNGGADDDYCKDDQDDNPDGPIDTWIFWITTPEGSASRYIHYGGTIMSSTVDVQFESWVSGGGVSHVELKIDNGKYKRLAPPNGEDNGYSYSYRTITGLSEGAHTIYARTVDKAGNVDPTPAQWKFTVIKDDDEGCLIDPVYCSATPVEDPETWINSVRTPEGKNIANGGSTTSKVVTVDFQSTATDTGKGSHVDLKIDNGRYKAVASPKTISGLSVGKHTISLKGVDKYGNEDPTPAKWTFTVKKDNSGGGYPDTWINWVRATPRGVNIANGGSTSSSTVIVDFQGTVAGKGSHIDLKIDNGRYKDVASPYTIKGLSDGTHTIYLKAVNQAGKADPTPAKWRFTVINDDNDD
jgi:hypothetical protein